MPEHLFTISGTALPQDALLVGFRGQEAISKPYRFELFITVSDGDALDAVLGTRVTLTFQQPPSYPLHGIIADVEILHEEPGQALSRLAVAPRWFELSLSLHSRVFTNETIPAVIEHVLRTAGLTDEDYELRLSGDYGEEHHVCQYKESDLAFLSRWMEREGMLYYFEHGDAQEKLVITDGQPSDSLSDGPVLYRPGSSGDSSASHALGTFRSARASRPAEVVLTDYDYENPSLEVKGSARAYERGHAVVRLHGERFFTPAEGQRLATLRAEELLASQARHRGHGRVFHLRPGYRFDLEGHAVSSINGAYLCTELRHCGNLRARSPEVRELTGLDHDTEYDVDVVGIDTAVQFRPERSTPQPRIHGLERATVDGPADSDYAQIDDQGRYHVVLHFDESGLTDGNASTAVRMMQPHAGSPEGMHFPLRKGTEVLVGFLGGDPDRPFIAGAIPNAHNPSAVATSNHTRNVIHTGGNNRIEMEDDAGNQWINLETPVESSYLHLGKPNNPSHHIVLESTGNCLFDFGTNQDIRVGGNLDEHVVKAVTETYGADHTSEVKGPQKTTVKKEGCKETYESTQTTLVGGDVSETYQAAQNTTVQQAARDELFLSGQNTTVDGGLADQEFTDRHLRTVASSTSTTHLGDYTRRVTDTAMVTYPAGLKRLWGLSKGTFATYNWVIPGGMNTVALNYKISVPQDNWTFLTNLKVTLLKIEMGFLSLGWTAAKMELTGLAQGATGSKMEAVGAAAGVTGVDLGVSAVESEDKAVKWKPKGAFIFEL